jgi:hypothetical protein
MWHLEGTNLAARLGTAKACPSSTQMPVEGNGTGAAIALVAAGLVGTVAVQRARRRGGATQASSHPQG